jgi:cytochrome c biogenesis protein CcmG, thiol:disulfide interchange protein DsbE
MLNSKAIWSLLLPLGIFVAIVIFLWVGLQRNPREIPSPLINKPAPEFRTPDLFAPQQQFTQQLFLGHVTLLNVFASWCEACQTEHAEWFEARRDLSKNTLIIGLNYKDDRSKALQWLTQYGNPYDYVIDDAQGQLGIDFGVYGTPETFVIDKHGIIRYKILGAVSPALWTQTLLPIVQKWANFPSPSQGEG